MAAGDYRLKSVELCPGVVWSSCLIRRVFDDGLFQGFVMAAIAAKGPRLVR
jgi:hypothetical protein